MCSRFSWLRYLLWLVGRQGLSLSDHGRQTKYGRLRNAESIDAERCWVAKLCCAVRSERRTLGRTFGIPEWSGTFVFPRSFPSAIAIDALWAQSSHSSPSVAHGSRRKAMTHSMTQKLRLASCQSPRQPAYSATSPLGTDSRSPERYVVRCGAPHNTC